MNCLEKAASWVALSAALILAPSTATALTVDTQQAGATGFNAPLGATYFVPTDAQKTQAPYYRFQNEDWGWRHNPLTGTPGFLGYLNISAYDVDDDFTGSLTSWENNRVLIWDAIDSAVNPDLGRWRYMDSLRGSNDAWAFTEIALESRFFDDMQTGLYVWIDIDYNKNGWAVAIAKSTLSLETTTLSNPAPISAVPLPGTFTMMLAGLGLMGAVSRRRKAKQA